MTTTRVSRPMPANNIRKSYIVNDFEDERELNEEERAEYEQERTQLVQNKKKISPNAKQRIEYLSGIGRMSDSINIDGVTFYLRSLKDYEIEEYISAIQDLGDITNFKAALELRRHILSRSLYKVDEATVEDMIGSNEFEDKYELIKNLDDNLVGALQRFYESNIIKAGKAKYEFSAKEIADDVKK